ncbi:hypothetical protein B0J12DRAFT_311072 [Macrophomina phaseolina]|uniref:Zn(2)-C6 fungal-type domain-containing protein n=1 Tax=Macrophomina phaseolina TaxID=35725 RepID=A0ABQ8FWS4_9PEZI|nr:hypothetical protein B0J12DRAFT_311072 [Macrophomina phaseolina]
MAIIARMRRKQATVCRTFRNHKLGCDGNRPSCSQCLVIGRPCEGYQLDSVFVSYVPKARDRQRKALSAEAYFSHSKGQARHLLDASSSNGGSREAPAHSTKALRSIVPKPIDSSTFEEFTAAILSRFMPAKKRDLYLIDPNPVQARGAWAEVLPALVDGERPGHLATSAVEALATALLERGPEGKYVNFQSFAAYHLTLRYLKKALGAQRGSVGIETVYSIACMVYVEAFARICQEARH